MFSNYLLVTYRHLLRHKLYSGITVLGLAVGVATFLLTWLYIEGERSFDHFHEKGDDTYRVTLDRYQGEDLMYKKALTFIPTGPRLHADLPEVENYTRMWEYSLEAPVVINVEEEKYSETNVYHVDSSFFSIFSFELLEGNPKTALTKLKSVVISESLAIKYFGNERAVGKTIQRTNYNGPESYEVTGVFKDVPSNSHLQFTMLFSWETITPRDDSQWGWEGFTNFVLLKEGIQQTDVEAKLPDFLAKYITGHWKERNDNNGQRLELHLQPLLSIYLGESLSGETGPKGNASSLYILGFSSLFILILAWVNCINLTTARLMDRSREAGMRKILGSTRGQLFRQFVVESMALHLVSLVLAFTLTQLGLAWLSGFSVVDNNLFHYFSQFDFLSLVVVVWLVGSLISGWYPSWLLATVQPSAVLKGQPAKTPKGAAIRHLLLVTQFTISLVALSSMLAVHYQLDFMLNQPLGFSKDRRLVVDILEYPGPGGRDSLFVKEIETLKDDMERQSFIKNASLSSAVPGYENTWQVSVLKLLGEDESDPIYSKMLRVDEDYLNAFDLELLAGRNFSKELSSDQKESAIVNESAVRGLGLASPEEAIGKMCNCWGNRTIIGVVKDYHTQSQRAVVQPEVMWLNPGPYKYLTFALGQETIRESVAAIQSEWETTFPEKPFSFFFLDEFYDRQYARDEQFGAVMTAMSVITVLLSVTGLFGLISYQATRRRKEIGIRKVLGASVANLILLLSKTYFRIVLIAIAIGLPVSFWRIQEWLDGFAYRIELDWTLLFTPVVVLLAITWLTMYVRTLTTARENPVDALRTE
ncbi:ABC transporter permease [uncultured Imperialibacter sp.]|mgnify:CR=1 FL=1|uniref:ABC transporter permease n=1 Tax=uncultured Imperialibacter sp. TaxID=1672639 RepID=UPI0030D985E3|tara:strand:- start:12657 stop:15101 length:2445 start_codon:yes stop_codon:yes gene_type:complete